MPIYKNYCEACQGVYESMRPMDMRDDPAPCPHCGQAGRRQVSAFGFKYEGHYFDGGSGERRRTDPHD